MGCEGNGGKCREQDCLILLNLPNSLSSLWSSFFLPFRRGFSNTLSLEIMVLFNEEGLSVSVSVKFSFFL